MYHKLSLISPGLIQRLKKKDTKGFGSAYKQRGLYPGGLINRLKKTFRKK